MGSVSLSLQHIYVLKTAHWEDKTMIKFVLPWCSNSQMSGPQRNWGAFKSVSSEVYLAFCSRLFYPSVKLTTHRDLVLRLRMYGAISLFPVCHVWCLIKDRVNL